MLSILGIVAIVVFSIQVYKTANGMERNGGLWAALTAVIGVGLQLVVPIFFGIVIGIYYVATGGDPENIDSSVVGWATVIGVVCFFLSIAGMWLVMKYVSKVPDTPIGSVQPPSSAHVLAGRKLD